MGLLNRVQSGLLFQSDFSGPQLDTRVWSLSPSDPSRINLAAYPGSVTLYPDNTAGQPAMMLLPMPTIDPFVFEIKNSFFPSTAGDMAGIVGYISEENKLALMQYYDSKSGPVSYTYQRIQYKDGIFTGWGSSDDGKTWNLLGSDSDAYAMIGVALYAPAISPSTPVSIPTSTPYEVPNSTPQATPAVSVTSPMIVDYVRIFSDNGITFANLSVGQTINLLAQDGSVFATQTCSGNHTTLFFDTTNIKTPFIGRAQIVGSDGNTIETSDILNMYPGDQFWFGARMHILLDTQEFSQTDDNYIGTLVEGSYRKKFQVHNPDSIPYNNVAITVESIQDTRRQDIPGWDWVALAVDTGVDPTNFFQTINIGTVHPGDSVSFWVDIQRPSNPEIRFETNFKFRLKLAEGG